MISIMIITLRKQGSTNSPAVGPGPGAGAPNETALASFDDSAHPPVGKLPQLIFPTRRTNSANEKRP